MTDNLHFSFAIAIELAVSVMAGGLLGLFFFGGLWWTLRRAFASQRTALWMGASLLFRVAGVIAGFVLLSAGDWRKLLACLLGFWMARWVVVRSTAGSAAQALGASLATAKNGLGNTNRGSG